jgi:hypothetical protein
LLTEGGLLDYLIRARGHKDSRTVFFRFVKFLKRTGVRAGSVESIPEMLLSVKAAAISSYPTYLESSKLKPSTVNLF